MPKNVDLSGDEGPIVYLGFIEDRDKIKHEFTNEEADTQKPSTSKDINDEDSLPPWLVNKLGGTPIFPLAGVDLQELESTLNLIKCKQCMGICALVLQMNSPIDESSFDRVMQLYCCTAPNCSKRSWFALRCMLDNKLSNKHIKIPDGFNSDGIEICQDLEFGPILACKDRSFFLPYYISVIEEPSGRENFAKNNLEALKLASKFSDPDLKPAPIEEKYKNLKNYKPPKPPAALSDLDDFEKFQMENLYSNDKDMYRYYKRLSRYQSQIVRYDWEGKPLLNSSKIKLDVLPCASCSSKRKYEFQLMSASINYLEKEGGGFDRDTLDFTSVIVHSCSKNCSKSKFSLEDTYFMPDPDSRIFNKVKQKMLAVKLADKEPRKSSDDVTGSMDQQGGDPTRDSANSPSKKSGSSRTKKKKNKNKNKK